MLTIIQQGFAQQYRHRPAEPSRDKAVGKGGRRYSAIWGCASPALTHSHSTKSLTSSRALSFCYDAKPMNNNRLKN